MKGMGVRWWDGCVVGVGSECEGTDKVVQGREWVRCRSKRIKIKNERKKFLWSKYE